MNVEEILETQFLSTHFEKFQNQINGSLEEFDLSEESINEIESLRNSTKQYESNLLGLRKKFNESKKFFDENYKNEIDETEKILQNFEKSVTKVSSAMETVPEKLKNLMDFKSKIQQFIMDIPQKFQNKIKDLITELTKDSINCDSVLEIHQSFEDLICGNILDGINGSWSGLGLLLAFLIPIMILSNYLDSSMRKSSGTDENDFSDFMANPSQHIYMNGNFSLLFF